MFINSFLWVFFLQGIFLPVVLYFKISYYEVLKSLHCCGHHQYGLLPLGVRSVAIGERDAMQFGKLGGGNVPAAHLRR